MPRVLLSFIFILISSHRVDAVDSNNDVSGVIADFKSAVKTLKTAAPHGLSSDTPQCKPVVALTKDQQRIFDDLFIAAKAVALAWPGYNLFQVPVLVRLYDGSALLFGSKILPPNFVSLTREGLPVSITQQRPAQGHSFEFNVNLSGIKVASFETANKAKVGSLAELVAHECFHRYQNARNFHWTNTKHQIDNPADMALATAENEALSRWVRAGEIDAIKDFAAARITRRSIAPNSVDEEGEENGEGTAFYIELSVTAAIYGSNSAKKDLLHTLTERTEPKDFSKTRAYPVGATMTSFLESQKPGQWQSQMESGANLSDLLLARLAMSTEEVRTRANRIMALPEYIENLKNASEKLTRYHQERDNALRQFELQAGTRVILKSKGIKYYSLDIIYDFKDGSSLLYPAHQFKGTGIDIRNKSILEIPGESFQFFISPNARFEVDGKVWTMAQGTLAYSSLKVTDDNVQLELGPGTIISTEKDFTIIVRD